MFVFLTRKSKLITTGNKQESGLRYVSKPKDSIIYMKNLSIYVKIGKVPIIASI